MKLVRQASSSLAQGVRALDEGGRVDPHAIQIDTIPIAQGVCALNKGGRVDPHAIQIEVESAVETPATERDNITYGNVLFVTTQDEYEARNSW